MDFRLVPRGSGRNYTGILTKTIVYIGTFILFTIGTQANSAKSYIYISHLLALSWTES